MPLPSFLQAMFTPERSGSYQWQNRQDQGGGEFTGEIEGVYEGDAQDLIFKPRAHRGPGNTVGQEMPSAVRPNPDGSGETTQTKLSDIIGDKMGELSSDDDVDMTSISEVMETSAPIGSMSGGWADKGDPGMVSGPMFAPSEPSSLPSGPMFAPGEPSSLPSRPMFVPSESSALSSPAPQDPMGSGIGGIRASDQGFTPPMAEDPGILESIKDKIVNMPAFHLNVAEQVGTGGSRSQFKQDRANTSADELAFGASADSRNMRKQPPGFWDFATGGLLKGPSQYTPSAWNIDIPGQVNPGIEAQISEHAQQRKILEDRESMLRARGTPEFKIQQAMGQHYTGPMTEGAL